MTRRKSFGKTGTQNGRLESMNATYDLQLGIEMIPAEGPTRNLKPQTSSLKRLSNGPCASRMRRASSCLGGTTQPTAEGARRQC